MPDLSHYGGRWVALAEDGSVAAVAETSDEARRQGMHVMPKGRVAPVWVSPHPPYVALPAWPIEPLRSLLPKDNVWLAGGAVRDLLMGMVPRDWDFVAMHGSLGLARAAADALGGKYYPLDAARGTGRALVTMPCADDTIALDFADMRGASIDEDLAARDFTINAMALSLDGRLIDPYGGRGDLAAALLRMVGPHSLQDDPARMLRAVRLATEFGLEIEVATAAHIAQEAALIERVSAERVRAELVKTLAAPAATRGLELLRAYGLFAYVVPELAPLADPVCDPADRGRAWSRVLGALKGLTELHAMLSGTIGELHPHRTLPRWVGAGIADQLAGFQSLLLAYLGAAVSVELTRYDMLKWALLLGTACKRAVDQSARARTSAAECAHERLFALRFPRTAIDFVSATVHEATRFRQFVSERRELPCPDPDSPAARRAIYRYFRATGDAGIGIALLAFAGTLGLIHTHSGAGTAALQARWLEQLGAAQWLFNAFFHRHAEVVDPPPLINGGDVMRMGVPHGPAVGEALERVSEAQAVGQLSTHEEALAMVRRLSSS